MFTKKFFAWIVILLLLGITTSHFASWSKQKGFILKQFKELEYELLFESDNVFLDGTSKNLFDSSKKTQLYKSIRDKVTEKRIKLEEENIRLINKIGNLEDSVALLEKDIESIQEETIKINNQIIEIHKKLSITQETITLLKLKISANKKILHKYIVYLYQQGSFAFQDGEIDNIKAILLSWDNVSSLLNDLHYKWIIELTWKKLIDNHRSFVSDLYVKKLALWKAQSESKSLRKQLIVNKAMMKQKKDFKEKLITVSQWKQQLYEKFIEDKRKTESNLRTKEFQERIRFNNAKKELLVKEWCKYVDFSRVSIDSVELSPKCKKLNSVIYIESKLRWFQTDPAWNIFKWPLAPTWWITAFFHDPGYVSMFWEDHDAIDVRAPQWTPLVAPADWYVVLVRPPVSASDYSFVWLKHSDGIITVYGHLSEVSVEEMDFVKAWEEFAKSGWAVWTLWAGLMTTWAHLHFEVWADKKLVDPLNYLDTSVLAPGTLPNSYLRKYKKDFKANKWFDFTWNLSSKTATSASASKWKRQDRVFKVSWDDEIARQKNFLTTYATGPFKTWSTWVEEWLDANLDPTFLICIGLAETSLGKHLKTPFNIWNVWNTDSWATMRFKSARDWISAMTRTLNNQYLWWYDEIQELSRYWNKDKPIYASSPDNWHNNIVWCMWHIKWRFVPDDYKFRLD